MFRFRSGIKYKFISLISENTTLLVKRIYLENPKAKKICILTTKEKNKKYPYQSSKIVLKQLHKKFKALYQNTRIYDLHLNYRTKQTLNFTKISLQNFDDLNEFYLPQIWVEADIRIVIVTPRIHRHHFRTFYYGHLDEILNIAFTNLKIPEIVSLKGYKSLIEPDREEYLERMKNINQKYKTYYFFDGRYIVRSNEHSFFSKIETLGLIFTADSTEIQSLENDFIGKISHLK